MRSLFAKVIFDEISNGGHTASRSDLSRTGHLLEHFLVSISDLQKNSSNGLQPDSNGLQQ